MQQLRRDPIIGRWIIVDYDHMKTILDYKSEALGPRTKGKICPFCSGFEDKTPPEIMVDRDPGTAANTPGWNLRVIANKFPALKIEGDLNLEGLGLYDQMNGVGAHEVIIETPDHERDLADLSQDEVARVILAYKQRCIDLRRDKRFKYILIFKNHGANAGASLEHSHSQLIALPIVPKKAKEALHGAQAYYNYKERCVYCDIIDQEVDLQERIVFENHDFVAFCPYVSCAPFETWIIPKRHASNFYQIKEEQISSCAKALKSVLSKLKKVLTDPPFNFIINTSPIQNEDDLLHYHWYIEIVPKLTNSAGFEWGTGFYINPTPPEKAAQWLRQAD